MNIAAIAASRPRQSCTLASVTIRRLRLDKAPVRASIENHADDAQTRDVREQRLDERPAVHVTGDACRSDRLVEIEGRAFSRHATVPVLDAARQHFDPLRFGHLRSSKAIQPRMSAMLASLAIPHYTLHSSKVAL